MATTTPPSSTPVNQATRTGLRLIGALSFMWLLQFGTVVWFMVGQGYDRATAQLIPVFGLALLPALAWLLRVGMPKRDGSRWVKIGKALLRAAEVYLAGVIVPAWIILDLLNLSSPFEELWWILGCSSTVLIVMLAYLKAPTERRILFPVLLVAGAAVGLLLMRLLVFSFFG